MQTAVAGMQYRESKAVMRYEPKLHKFERSYAIARLW